MSPNTCFAQPRAEFFGSGTGASLGAVRTLWWIVVTLACAGSVHGQTGWQSQDIGTSVAGATSEAAGSVSLTGSGYDIWNDVDGFRYHYREIAGDFDLIVRVASIGNTHGWAKAGIMARWNTNPDSAFAFMCVSAAHGTAFQWRSGTGTSAETTAPSEDGSAPRWLRLTRIRNDFGGFTSHDGVNWTYAGRWFLTSAPSVLIGLAVTSHNDGVLCTAQFDNVAFTTAPNAPSDLRVTHRGERRIDLAWTDNSANEEGFVVESRQAVRDASWNVQGGVGANLTSFSATGLAEGQVYEFRVKSVIGSAGSYSFPTSSQVTVTPHPFPISVTSSSVTLQWDEMATTFGGSPGTGPYAVERSLDNTNFTQIASGVRGTLLNSTQSRTTFTDSTVAPSTTYYYRVRYLDTNGDTSGYGTPPGPVSTPAGSSDTTPPTARMMYYRQDGETLQFRVYFSEEVTGVDLPDFFAVGTGSATALFQSVSAPGVEGSEQFYTIVLTPSGVGTITVGLGTADTGIVDRAGNSFAGGTPPGGSLTATHTVGGWVSRDIGAVASGGETTETRTGAIIRASGADIWERSDEFRYRYQTWAGDGQITAEVRAFSAGAHPWAKAGVMFRESLDPASRHVFMCLSAGNGTALQSRGETGGTTATSPPSGTVSHWVRLERTGNVFTGFVSNDGVVWSRVQEFSMVVPSEIYVGLAVTSHDDGQLVAAEFANIQLRGLTPNPSGPAQPTGLAAVAATSNRVELTWTDNANNETGYEIHRSVDISAGQLLATIGANATIFSDTSVEPGRSYLYNVRAVNANGPSQFSNTAYVTTPEAPPPGGWTSSSVGAVAATGSVSSTDGVFNVRGSGADIWERADEFHFVHRPVTGDHVFTARVTGIEFTHVWAKAGLMFREALTPDARYAMALVSGVFDAGFQHRAAVGAETGIAIAPIGRGPVWVRIVRTGSRFESYYSLDGATWTTLGGVSLDLPGTLHVGLAVTSHNDGVLCNATFDNVTLEPLGSTGPVPAAPTNVVASALSATRVDVSWMDNASDETSYEVERSIDNIAFAPVAALAGNTTSYSDLSVSPATTYYYRVRAARGSVRSPYGTAAPVTTPSGPPSTWASLDIGSVAVAGATETAGNTITIRASGADIWDGADAFRFLHRQVLGDGVVEARVASLQNTNNWAKAGVMIRESLAPDARNVFAAVTPVYHGVIAQARTETGGQTTHVAGPGRNAPVWLRLAKTGSAITASWSEDGIAWTPYATYSVSFGATTYFGFAVTSHDNTQLTTAVFADPFVQ